MLIGLLSDTHDRVPAVAEFSRRFSEAGVRMILHAGDFCSPFSLRPLLTANIPLAGVFGHNDGDVEGLRAVAATGMGVELYQSPHSVDVAGEKLLLVHDMNDVSDQSLASHAIVVHGGTHLQEMKHRGDALLINPGEACGWLYGAPCAAILNVADKHAEFLKLDGPEWAR